MEIDLKKISKYISYLLRHKPQSIGLELDASGWARIDELIDKTTDFQLTREILDIVVETNDKQRFCISDDGARIKANQGHSIEIELDLQAVVPPDVLLHGTAERFMKSIEQEGLQKMKRHHVHLTESETVARNVGGRYGKPVILRVAASVMHQNGFKFFKTKNNVWLVDHVPCDYISS